MAPPRPVVFELERLQLPVLAEGLGQAEEPHLTRDVGGLEQGRLPHRNQPTGSAPQQRSKRLSRELLRVSCAAEFRPFYRFFNRTLFAS